MSTGHLHLNGFESVVDSKKEKPHLLVWFSFLCKYPNFEMLRPPGGVFPVKGGSLFPQGGSFLDQGGAFLDQEGVGIFTEGVTVVFMPINTQNRPLCSINC